MRNQDFSRGHCQFVEEGTVLQSLAYNGSREWVYSPSPRIPEAWGAQGGVESSSSSSGRAGRAWWRETAECSPQHGSDTFQPPPAPPLLTPCPLSTFSFSAVWEMLGIPRA